MGLATTLRCFADSLPTFFYSAWGSERTVLVINCRQWTWNYLQLQHGCCLDVYWKSSPLNIKKVFFILNPLREKELFWHNSTQDWTGLIRASVSLARRHSVWSLHDSKPTPRAFGEPSRLTAFSASSETRNLTVENAFLHPRDGGPIRWKRIYICGKCTGGQISDAPSFYIWRHRRIVLLWICALNESFKRTNLLR